MRQLVVVRRICCCSQSMSFLLELLGPAIGCLAGPSSSNRKIMDWEQQQILLTTTNCLILPVHGRIFLKFWAMSDIERAQLLPTGQSEVAAAVESKQGLMKNKYLDSWSRRSRGRIDTAPLRSRLQNEFLNGRQIRNYSRLLHVSYFKLKTRCQITR